MLILQILRNNTIDLWSSIFKHNICIYHDDYLYQIAELFSKVIHL